jgi:catechol 2,3-dioxygenase-like lactoylglutathione lyase family enzyme
VNAWPKNVGAITLFVEDPQRSKSFYENVFGLGAIFEDENSVVFRFENMLLNVLRSAAAHGLIEPAQVASREAGSRFQFTIWVDDVDAVCDEVTGRGVELLNGPLNRDWGQRTISFTDPDGHIWEIAQELPDPGES